MAAYQVLIVEDEELLRNGMELIINKEQDMEVVATAENGLQALKKLDEVTANLILLDIQMPVMNGIELLKKIRNYNKEVIILILTTFNDEKYIIEGLANGANGYLIKRPAFHELIPTIRDAMNGNYILPGEVATKLVQYIYNRDFLADKRTTIPTKIIQGLGFTKREQDIIVLLLDRLSNREISETLFISEGTIKNYLTTIYEKLGVKNRHEAIQYLHTLVR